MAHSLIESAYTHYLDVCSVMDNGEGFQSYNCKAAWWAAYEIARRAGLEDTDASRLADSVRKMDLATQAYIDVVQHGLNQEQR